MRREHEERTLNRAALRNLVEGSSVGFRQNGRSYILWCPKCSKQKLHIEKATGRSKCFRCGDDFKGYADTILAVVLGRPRSELSEELYGLKVSEGTGAAAPLLLVDHWGEFNDEDDEFDDEDEVLAPMFDDPSFVGLDTQAGERGRIYLEGRGIPLSLAQEYGIRYLPREQRIIFPIVIDGEQVGWQARYIGRTEYHTEEGKLVTIPKVITTGQVTGRCVMFQDRLRGCREAVLAEGPIDAIKCHVIGGNVACMGKGEAVNVLPVFVRYGIRDLYVGLDDDAADDIMRVAHAAAWRDDLRLWKLETPPGREDLGASSYDEVVEQKLVAKRLTASQVFCFLAPPPVFY